MKSVKFKEYKYIGDPINAVRIFNEKEVDELVFLDISAGRNGGGPNFELLTDIASEAFMPFAYGGGIRELDDVKKLNSIGVEKVILNTIASSDLAFVARAASVVGSSGVVVSIDVKRDWLGRYRVFSDGGTKNTNRDPLEYVKAMESCGAGEVLLNSIDHDGMMEGYDLQLIKSIAESVSIPVVAVGGAGTVAHFNAALDAGASAVAAGSMFVFYGVHKGVLITYPQIDTMGDKIHEIR